MKVIDILKSSKQPFASFELVPPLKGSDVSRLYDSIEPLMEFEPPFINVTCHRDEIEYVPNSNGTYTKMTLAKRPSTIAIVTCTSWVSRMLWRYVVMPFPANVSLSLRLTGSFIPTN